MLAFYFLVIGHVSRAWIMIGVSIRFALALGLHLRNEDPSADFRKKEALARTWWSLHMIECLISVITGRPPVLSHEDCTVPLPQDVNDRSHGTAKSESGQHKAREAGNLHHSLQLSQISEKALLSLYSPRTAAHSWEVRTYPNIRNEVLTCNNILTSLFIVHPGEDQRAAQGTRRVGKACPIEGPRTWPGSL